MEAQNENEYAKQFNQGYMLGKFKPELLAQIVKGNENSDYIKALKQGAKQAEREKVRARHKSDFSQSNEQDNGIDID